MSARFVISLDFEMFWGVTDALTIESYAPNVRGERAAIPAMLDLFKQFKVSATWATVGMLMCKDHADWTALCPSTTPCYRDKALSNYNYSDLAKSHPDLFFAPELVDTILQQGTQELGSHTFSHLYAADGPNASDFALDIDLQLEIFSRFSVRPKSLVFPRNQVSSGYLDIASRAGVIAFRGNQDNFIHAQGHTPRFGLFGRACRYMDSFLPIAPISRSSRLVETSTHLLVDVPASAFLRPSHADSRDSLHLRRLTTAMTKAAQSGSDFHLWWHPHNFGRNLLENLALLRAVLEHFRGLQERFGMVSRTMGETARELLEERTALHTRTTRD